ncbi:MAG: radical SAM protein [Tissierellia bacterium]|nr:radical SAM protein [Tissierellia bacterium]
MYYVKKFRIRNKLYCVNLKEMEIFEISDKKEFDDYVDNLKEDDFISRKITKELLPKLVLNISNNCNLNCIYCYANQGNYGRKNRLMNKDTINKIIDDLINKGVKNIEIVELFGGEPLINNNIEYIVSKLNENFKIKKYIITTNGTQDLSIIEPIIAKNNVKVAVSLDGPEDIHDELRGEGTFKKAENFINELKKINLDNEISCTYTLKHDQKGYSLSKIENYLKGFGLPFHINNVITDDLNLKRELVVTRTQAIERTKNDIKTLKKGEKNYNLDPFLIRVIQAFLLGTVSIKFCDELDTEFNLAYDYNGDVYSCFKMWGDEDYRLIDNKTNNKKLEVINDKNNINKCKNCFTKYLCNFCVKDTILKNESIPYKQDICPVRRRYEDAIELFLEEIDKGEIEILINNVKDKILW